MKFYIFFFFSSASRKFNFSLLEISLINATNLRLVKQIFNPARLKIRATKFFCSRLLITAEKRRVSVCYENKPSSKSLSMSVEKVQSRGIETYPWSGIEQHSAAKVASEQIKFLFLSIYTKYRARRRYCLFPERKTDFSESPPRVA